MVRPAQGGPYYITNVASNTRLDLNNGSNVNGTAIQGWSPSDTDNQRWMFSLCTDFAEECYWIFNCASRTMMDLNNGSRSNGTRVQGWDRSASAIKNQPWRVIDEGGDRYRLRNMQSGTDLDLNDGGRSNGTRVQGWSTANTDAQRWRFELLDDYASYSEGQYDLFEFTAKLDACKAMLERGKADPSWKHVYGVAFNMSRAGLYDPIDAVRRLSNGINEVLSADNISRDGRYRIGTIEFDFYDNNIEAVRNVIRSNRGCGSL